MTDCPNDIIERTIEALEKCRHQRQDGTPVNDWQGLEGADAINHVAHIFEALKDGIVQLAEATAYQGPGLSKSEKDALRGGLADCWNDTLLATEDFNADVDPADTLADWHYDCRDQA